jgi:hypothetical protein
MRGNEIELSEKSLLLMIHSLPLGSNFDIYLFGSKFKTF